MTNKFVENLVNDALTNAENTDAFKECMCNKVTDALEVRKVEIASTLIRQNEEWEGEIKPGTPIRSTKLVNIDYDKGTAHYHKGGVKHEVEYNKKKKRWMTTGDYVYEEAESVDEGDLSVRTLYNRYADRAAASKNTKPVEKAIGKVHGKKVLSGLKKAAASNLAGKFDKEEGHFNKARDLAGDSDRIGATVGRNRSAFRKQYAEEAESVEEEWEGEMKPGTHIHPTKLVNIDYDKGTAHYHKGGAKHEVKYDKKKKTWMTTGDYVYEEAEQVNEKYIGFQKLKASIAKKGGARNAAAVAAAIGRKKYGKEKFQAMAAAGKKK